MVFKGFTDENGNVIPVQGAGTVYNEELNSLALGKGTSAIGKDQLVFGRYNEEDANKAEIVGGGSVESGTRTITTVSEIIMAISKMAIESDCTIAANRLATPIDVIKVGDTIEEVIAWMRSKGASITELTINGISESNVLAYFVNDISYSGDNIEIQILQNLWLVSKNNELVLPERNYRVVGTRYTINGVSTIGTLVSVTAEMDAETKTNIRTLDWAGNEKLAGGLTVGTGITIGGTSLSEAELIALKALLNS